MTNPVHIHFSLKEGNIGIIEFDLQGKPVNLLSPEVLEELSQVLDSLREPDPPEGLIFLSRKKDSFIGGAQIEPEKLFKNRDETVRFIQTGRDLFDQIANLPFPTLAAVHGPALGGGLELALACRYRMASSHPRTRLGLPEVMLGILPAWGGTTRLPRLVGLQSALDLLLTGKQVSPKQALRMGLIDRVATTENIGPQARVFMRQIIETGPGFQEKIRRARGRSRKGTSTWFLDKTRPGRAMVFSKARQTVLARTRGHYPAPIKILEVVKKGLSLPVARALPLEQGAMEALMEEETTRNLMHVFALQMGAGKGLPKSESAPGGKTPSLEKIGVLGGGAMGSGIAQWILGRGLQVRLKDINEAAVGNGIRTIHQLFDTLVSRRRLTLFEKEEKLHRLSSTTAYSGFKSCGLVIEAVAEKLDIKKSVIRELQDKAGSDMLFATNTSSLSVDKIAEDSGDPSKVLGLHFFNPVSKMPLVEVVRGTKTSDQTLSSGVRFIKQIGKIPLVVSDSPGFLVNRILMAYANEAALLLEEGAGVEQIDQAIEEFGMAMGPFRMMDVVGLDIAFHAGHSIQQGLALDPGQQAGIVETLFRADILGDKSGGGFYRKTGKNRSVNSGDLNPHLSEIRKSRNIQARGDFTKEELTDRLFLIMANTGAWCLEKNVVQSAGDVDLGMIMGTGFPPFKGGLLKYTEAYGLGRVFDNLIRLEQEAGSRFKPSPLFNGGRLKTFYTGNF